MRQNALTFIQRPRKARVLVFGPTKSGKTRSLITLWRMGVRRFWIWDFDDGAEAFINLVKDEKGFNPDDIIIFNYIPKKGDKVGDTQFRPRQQGKELFLDFLKDWNGLQDQIDNTTGLWVPSFQAKAPEVVVLDGLTSLQDIILDFCLALAGHDIGAPNTDARNDYGAQMGKLQEIIESAKALPCMLVVNAHEKIDKNELTSETRIDPLITGKSAPANFAKSFSVSVYTRTKKKRVGEEMTTEYFWLTQSDGMVKSTGLRTKEGLPREIPQDYKIILN